MCDILDNGLIPLFWPAFTVLWKSRLLQTRDLAITLNAKHDKVAGDHQIFWWALNKKNEGGRHFRKNLTWGLKEDLKMFIVIILLAIWNASENFKGRCPFRQIIGYSRIKSLWISGSMSIVIVDVIKVCIYWLQGTKSALKCKRLS